MKDRTPDKFSPEQWASVIRGLESRPSTINDYRKVLNLLHSHENGTYHILKMSREQAEDYFKYLDNRQAEGTLSENTVHRYKATLRSIGARIEKDGALVPGYTNPFSRLVTNENRKRTDFRTDMFADPSDIQKLKDAFPSFTSEERLILSLMMNLGLTPSQIQNLRICDFLTLNNGNEKLAVKINEGTFIEHTSKPWKESAYYTEGYPVHYVRKSPNRSITWNYTGTYVFQPEFEQLLRDYYEYVGVSTDMRFFFLTTRHLEFNYRAMHHMILSCCNIAGIEPGTLTPNMVSRYGMIHSYLLHTFKAETERLKKSLEQAGGDETNALEEQLRKNEEQLAVHIADGYIGDWQDRYPIPLQERIDSIREKLGDDFLSKAVGH